MSGFFADKTDLYYICTHNKIKRQNMDSSNIILGVFSIPFIVWIGININDLVGILFSDNTTRNMHIAEYKAKHNCRKNANVYVEIAKDIIFNLLVIGIIAIIWFIK